MHKQPNIQEVKALDAFCELCGNNHDASECGQTLQSSCYVGNYNKNTMSNSYNPAWRNHPNFSWKNQNNALNSQQPNQQGFQILPRQNPQQILPRQEYQQPNDYKNLENTLTQFMAQTSAYMARTDRPIGGFPSDTEVAKGATHEQCKAIIKRSGRVLKPTINQKGTATNLSAATDAPAEADEPAETDEDHNDPYNTSKGESSAESTHTRTDKSEEVKPPPPFPQRLKKQKHDYQFKKFFDILKQVHINLTLVEALQRMPNYAKFLKDIVSRKKQIEEFETAAATETCLALMHNMVLAKKANPGSFTIECSIGHNYSTKALCDPGASINLMPKSVFKKLGIGEARPTTVMLQLADHSSVQPEGKIEDILIRIDKFIFPVDFLILDCEANEHVPIILGRPFLATGRVLLDFGNDELILRVDDQHVKIDIHRTNKYWAEAEDCQMIEATSEFKLEIKNTCLGREETSNPGSIDTNTTEAQTNPETGNWVQLRPGKYFEPLNYTTENCKIDKPSIEQPPKLELKTLPEQLKYAYLGPLRTRRRSTGPLRTSRD
ncbi:hypothetical protein V6N12_036889 [Hibiscus sabdariffa]|uniref:Retrotransposon gag domain-containing protein n=1 Tax=Hibiscus sabdariffa TaxID=183260 RepID=A0ABR2BV10_9ROSI